MMHSNLQGVTFPFDGDTYVPARDHARLKNSLQRVFVHLLDGKWHTLQALRGLYGSGADSRIRDLRKDWCGNMTIDVRSTDDAGVHEYRLDVEAVDPMWAQRILDNHVKDPANTKIPMPSSASEMRAELHTMIDKIPEGKELAQCYRLIKKRLPSDPLPVQQQEDLLSLLMDLGT